MIGRGVSGKRAMEDGREYVPGEIPGWVINFVIRALAGMAVIFFVNYFLDSRGIDMAVGIGPVSLLTSGVLGIPGVALLYGIVLYQSL